MTVEMNTKVISPKLRENQSRMFSSRAKRFSVPLLPTMKYEELKPKRGRIFSVTSKEICTAPNEESYYFSADIVDEDLLENLDTVDSSETGSSADSGVGNMCNVTTCTPILTPQVCEIQRRLGLKGGTLTLPDCNMSLHILTNEDISRKTSQTSSVMGVSFKPINFVKKLFNRSHHYLNNCQEWPDYDSRISFSHTSPPDWLNNSYQMVAGGTARIDFVDVRVLQNNAILQLNWTLNHKSIYNNDKNITCETSCVISNTPTGPFTEIDSNYCRFYNDTAQITLCHTMIRKIAGMRKSIYVTPIIKLYPCPSRNLFEINLCVTDLVMRVAIYGEEFFRDITRCSVLISRSNAVEPVMRDHLEQKTKLLHLWCSFSISFNSIQPLHISIEANHLGIETSSTCVQSQNSIFVSADDMAKCCNINNFFTLHRHRTCTNEHFMSPSPIKASNNLVIFINGLADGIAHKLNIKTPGLAPNLRASSPIRRWKNIQVRPMNFITKRPPTQSKLFESIWFDVDETESKFKQTSFCPNANRKLTIPFKAVIRNVNQINKSNQLQSTHIKNGQVAAILGNGLIANAAKISKIHHIVLAEDKIVFVAADQADMIPAEKLNHQTHENAQTIVSILSRQFYALPDVSCDIPNMINLLLNHIHDWKMFSELVGFRPDFIEKVLTFVDSKSHITIVDLKLIYLRKFVKFCDNERTFLTEVVRVCLLMEEYNLMEEVLLHISIKYVSGFVSQHDGEFCNKLHLPPSSFSTCKGGPTVKVNGGYDPTVSEEHCQRILQLPKCAINFKQRILFESFVNNILIIIYSCQVLGRYSTRL